IVVALLSASILAYSQEVTREIKITNKYLNLPVQIAQDRQEMSLTAKKNEPRNFVIRLSKEQPDYWVFHDVSAYKGKTLTITYPEKVKGLEDIYQSDQITGADSLYKEKNRPQFHFTSQRGWNNDPNGLVYYDGEYHLYYQHNPYEADWENMHWGHAVSTDLIYWDELGDKLFPDELGTMFSGSAVVDHNNTSGFQTGDEKVLVAAYTAHKKLSDVDAIQTQCIAYSNDKGRTWTKYEGNPVIDSKAKWNSTHTRDPKVFWHEASDQWVMVLFEKTGQSIYNSDNLKDWAFQSHLLGFWECPELFELPIDGDENNKKWVIYGASGTYMIGDFNGKEFKQESGKLQYAAGQLYAAQTYNNIPEADGRRIQMGWGRIENQGMPFKSLMVFPTVLTLRTTQNGVRLFSEPIEEVKDLHKKSYNWTNLTLAEANENLKKVQGDLFHIKMEVEILNGTQFQFHYNGNPILTYSMNHNLVNGTFYPGDGTSLTKKVELLVDRTSVEAFVDDGGLTIVDQLEAAKNDNGLEFFQRRPGKVEPIKVHQLEVHELKSIWNSGLMADEGE
ncbi:MAG: DUF4980 domain-containing protein, partial [Cyclobacteriaceae bacterium]